MNAEPDELAIKILRGEVSHGGEIGNFVDAAASAGPTHPSDGPDRRIDYIFAMPGVGTKECKTVLAGAVDGVRASDHLGVLGSFE